jgi:hypothetical protein
MRRLSLSVSTFGAAAALLGGLLATSVVSSPAALAATAVPYSSTPVASWRTDGVGYATAIIGNTAYVGGDFTHVISPNGSQTLSRTGLAAFDLTTGALISTFTANVNGTVYSLATDGTKLFVGGTFSTVNGAAHQNIAAVDPTTGAALAWKGSAGGTVYALQANGARVYAGGSFLYFGGTPAARLGAASTADGTRQAWAPVADNTVHALAVSSDGSAIWAGGEFTSINAATHTSHIAEINPSGTVIASSLQHVDNMVLGLSLAADGTHLAISQGGAGNNGGWWTISSGVRNWQQICDGDGQAVLAVGDDVYTGFHDGCNADQTVKLVANSISGNGARDTTFTPAMPAFFGTRALAANSRFLVDGGTISGANGIRLGGFAIFPLKPADTTPPSVPGTLSAAGTTATSTNLAWGAATDNQGVAGYQVVRNGVTLPTTVTGLTFNDSGLSPSTTYQYVVRAVDGAGNVGPASNQVSVTTPAAVNLRFADAFTGANGSSWDSAWSAGSSAGSVTVQGNAGQLAFNDTSGAYARAQLTGDNNTAGADLTMSYQWSSTSALEYSNVYLRGSGGWQNAYRPLNGYGLELSSTSSTVALRKNVNGVTTTLTSVSGAQTVSTGKHWLRLRTSGSTIQYKIWNDGQSEPTAWTSTVTDSSVSAAGQLFVSAVRSSTNAGTKSWTLDDLRLSNPS